jgi:Flp pilus assembly protein TadD
VAALAVDLDRAGQKYRAMEQINRIFAIDPRYPKAHETLGAIFLRRGMYKAAKISSHGNLREKR